MRLVELQGLLKPCGMQAMIIQTTPKSVVFHYLVRLDIMQNAREAWGFV